MFKKGKIVKTIYGETKEVMIQIGCMVYVYGENAPYHHTKVFSKK